MAKLTRDEFIVKSNIANNFKYDYEKTIYTNNRTKVIITCPIHGDFLQTPSHHLNGTGCQKCSGKTKLTTEEFIEKSLLIYPENTIENYKNSIYVDNYTEVIIKCNLHGNYNQFPAYHLRGYNGCKHCKSITSGAENEIFDFISTYVECESNNRKIIKPKELDIYIPDLKIGIEYHGLIWHSERFKEDRNYHLDKLNSCNSKGLKLIQIFEDEWLFKKEIVKSRLLNIINKTPNKIYARKCKINLITSKEARIFLNENHIQGFVGGSVYLGLFYDSELVSIMTFGGLRKNLGQESKEGSFELLRFCNKINTSVIGGASKLFKYFCNNFNPNEVISYADRRWSEGSLYENLNFDLISKSIPNYFYTKNYIRENRFKYRKSELIKKGFDSNKTEKEIMSEKGYYRIYDCGTLKFKWKKDS